MIEWPEVLMILGAFLVLALLHYLFGIFDRFDR